MAKNAEKETALYEAVFRLLARGEKMYSVTVQQIAEEAGIGKGTCLLYTSPSPRDRTRSRMPSSA